MPIDIPDSQLVGRLELPKESSFRLQRSVYPVTFGKEPVAELIYNTGFKRAFHGMPKQACGQVLIESRRLVAETELAALAKRFAESDVGVVKLGDAHDAFKQFVLGNASDLLDTEPAAENGFFAKTPTLQLRYLRLVPIRKNQWDLSMPQGLQTLEDGTRILTSAPLFAPVNF